ISNWEVEVMRVLFSPQRSDDQIEYSFSGETITATIDEQSDTFDFSQMPDGEMVEVETTLPVNPIISARRTNGVLEVVLLNFIGPDATENEKYPDWVEV